MTAFFNDVVGQLHARRQLLAMAASGRMPHALLLSGQKGNGKMPLALAMARYLCCSNPQAEDACGACPACKAFNRLMHPDIHFAFPIVKLKPGKEVVCNDYIDDWRQFLLKTGGYIDLPSWLDTMNAQNKQAQIFTKETDEIQRKLAFKPSMGNRKVMIIWLPEKMNAEAANKLLKLLEEPPLGTVFLLVSEEPEAVLGTIRSRTQTVIVPPLTTEDISGTLQQRYLLPPADARQLAVRAHGDLLLALQELKKGDENTLFFTLFVNMMRLSYGRRLKEMKEWSEQVAALGREKQKSFLEYCQRMTRESFVHNFHLPELNAMNQQEEQFTDRFAPFVNTRNVMGIMAELERAQQHIEQNVNPKMVLFDLALQMIVLLKQ